MNNKLADNLKKIRKDNNLSQEQLAESLGVSRQAISKWESGLAYPEMDKIIQLCNKFELNIDDLLNKDIREMKNEEKTKNNINKILDSFLNFITDTINLFYNMSFKSKIKCLFEQAFIILFLILIFYLLGFTLEYIFREPLSYLQYDTFMFIWNLLKMIYTLFSLITAFGILIYIFKTRYLDYYQKVKDIDNNEINNDNKILFKNSEEKIIIRDPKHSEYKFINAIFKIFIICIKIFSSIILLFLSLSLIFLLGLLVISFIISKTGIFFIGILLALLSLSIINLILIIILLNFIFNRKINKKRLIITFIISIITLGISIGLIFIGSLKFNYISIYDEKNDLLIRNKIEIDMNNDLYIIDDNIEYIEKDIDNIEMEIETYKLVNVNYYINQDNQILFYKYPVNVKEIFDNTIKDLNNFKVVEFDTNIYSVKVFASKDNLSILKENSYEKLSQLRGC